MFTSFKTDAPPLSRQSSVDVPVSPSSSALAPEHRTSQYLEDYTNGTMRSPEQRHRAHSSKRSSVFNLRARSNTATSTTASFASLNPPAIAHSEASHPGSPLVLRQYGPQVELSGYRKSLFRGKKGKRLSESVSSSMIVTEYQEMDFGDKRTSVLWKTKKRNNQSEGPPPGLKHRISSPFGFQHLTHTDRHQFAAFAQSSGDKLAPGFREVRTSRQAGNDLPGSNNDDMHFDNFSSDNLIAQGHQSPISMSFGSPPQSPERFCDLQQPDTAPQEQTLRPALRLTRSVESFSQPGVTLRTHRHSQSVLAPPRISSLAPLASIDNVPENLLQKQGNRLAGRSRSKRESGIWDSFSLAAAEAEPHLPGIRDDSIYVGHALTTPDDTAIQAMTPPFSPSLDDVAEEPERFVRPRPAPAPPMRSPTTPNSPNFDSSIFNNQRSPIARSQCRGNSHSSPRSYSQRSQNTRPMSQMSETLGSSDLVRRGSVRKPSAIRRKSNTWRVPEESWEDDIDYIYEHALEADCDFEWDRASDEETNNGPQTKGQDRHSDRKSYQQPPPALQAPFDPLGRHRSRDFRASLLVPSTMGTPDLEPTSATSASTMEAALTTPCDPFHRTSSSGMGEFISPSLLVPQEYKEDREHMYEDLLNEYESSERHFTMLGARHSSTSSARSRRSSYDSSLISSAQSSGLWSSPVRRSASSAGSVPDLVPSRRTRRDLSFSLVIDQLSDSVASLSHLDEEKEDNDVTPPGRVLENRTFFPSDDESQEPITQRTSIEDELRTSLELAQRGSQRVERKPEPEPCLDLARNGSQRSTHAPARHRKQAMSDGATKLLSEAPSASGDQHKKSRHRAATTSQTARSPMLNLFPSPPRNSPTPNRM